LKKKKTVHLRKKVKRNYNRRQKVSVDLFRAYMRGYYLNKRATFKLTPYKYLRKYQGINHRSIQFILRKYATTKMKFRFLSFKKRKFIKKFKNLFTHYFVNDNKLTSIKAEKRLNVIKIKNLYIYISYRHFLSLPVRGQRTKTNAKTRKYFSII
jgi:ribosomal protein S13